MKSILLMYLSYRNNILVIISMIGLWFVFSYFDVFESLYEISRSYENIESDELILLIMALPMLYLVSTRLIKKRVNLTSSYNHLLNNKETFVNSDYNIEYKSDCDANWILRSSEAERLIKNFSDERGGVGFSDEEVSMLLNWANNVRHYENILNMAKKNIIKVDVLEGKIKIRYNI